MLTMVFDTELAGHHMEYLHHIYTGAKHNKNEKYLFYLPEEFKNKRNLHEWEKADNIDFRYFSTSEIEKCSKSNIYINAWNTSRLLRKKVKETGSGKVLLISFIELMLFICILLPGRVKVTGIIYRIYLYEKESMGFLRSAMETLRYWLAARSKCIDRILILNDEDSAKALNSKYSTNKCQFLTDPVPHVDMSGLKNLREELHIPVSNKVFLHFGGLSRRKGTIDILKAISCSNKEDMESRTFIIAGRVYDEIREDFYSLLSLAQAKAQVLVFDQFCTYEFIYDLCYSADILLMPYKLTNLSSGVLGYASLFKKPVIGPSGGLIGRLIKSHNLGLALENITTQDIKKAILMDSFPDISSEYADKNTQESFIKTILNFEN